jgi:hypothetical protein
LHTPECHTGALIWTDLVNKKKKFNIGFK